MLYLCLIFSLHFSVMLWERCNRNKEQWKKKVGLQLIASKLLLLCPLMVNCTFISAKCWWKIFILIFDYDAIIVQSMGIKYLYSITPAQSPALYNVPLTLIVLYWSKSRCSTIKDQFWSGEWVDRQGVRMFECMTKKRLTLWRVHSCLFYLNGASPCQMITRTVYSANL